MATVEDTDVGRFGDVDAASSPQRFIAWVEWVEQLPQSAALRRRSYELLGARAGGPVVDVGCGTGRAVAELAELGAKAVGVEVSKAMLRAARHRFPTIDLRVGRAEALPLGDATVLGYRAERLFQHLADPSLAVAEARRVLAKGGVAVVVDQDYDAWVLDSDDPRRTREVARALSDSIASRWIGRSLRALLLDAGLANVSVELQSIVYTDHAAVAPALGSFAGTAVAAGALTRAQADEWLAGLADRARRGRFFFALPFFLARATRPFGPSL